MALALAAQTKAWIWSDTVAGANVSAVVYSIMLACHASNIKAYSYLRHVLTEMPQRPADADVTDLLSFKTAKVAHLGR